MEPFKSQVSVSKFSWKFLRIENIQSDIIQKPFDEHEKYQKKQRQMHATTVVSPAASLSDVVNSQKVERNFLSGFFVF